jgi:hypothetical protein
MVSDTANPSTGTGALSLVLGTAANKTLKFLDSIGYYVTLGTYGANVTVHSDVNDFFTASTGHGLTLTTAGVIGGTMTSGNVGSLVAGTEYTVVLKVTPNEGYE